MLRPVFSKVLKHVLNFNHMNNPIDFSGTLISFKIHILVEFGGGDSLMKPKDFCELSIWKERHDSALIETSWSFDFDCDSSRPIFKKEIIGCYRPSSDLSYTNVDLE